MKTVQSQPVYKTVSELLQKFKSQQLSFNPNSIMITVVKLMQLIESFTGLDGQHKKEAVIETLKVLIEESVPNTDPNFTLVEETLLFVVPAVIDELVTADKNGLGLNKRSSLLSCCR